VTDPLQPVRIAQLDTPGDALAIAVDPPWAFIADAKPGRAGASTSRSPGADPVAELPTLHSRL